MNHSDTNGLRSANRLIDETSPYLLQHAHNPVDWYPWGDEAIARARAEDKPIFLSVGYSACHWCHVMEQESFEDETIAAFLNAHFIPVKVDREERPDVDQIYMDAVQIMTGQGGWPMSVWLTPDLKPFYAGTYFPPEDRWGRAGFLRVLQELHEVWVGDRDRITQLGDQMQERLELVAAPQGPSEALSLVPLERAYQHLERAFDSANGGFDGAPKFPPSMQLHMLLHLWAAPDANAARRARILEIVETTLVRMASGGLYDHLGGGFHRYSVDERWLIPHFEKMLYDNALLSRAYLEAYQITRRPFYVRVVRETLDYVLREMVYEHEEAWDRRPFYATQDADSEGEEGKFFVWTPEELQEALGPEEGRRAAVYWGVSREGNFEKGRSALHRLHHLDEHGVAHAEDALTQEIAGARRRLFEARKQRVAPETDTKILAGWNGLMISALARAGAILQEPRYLDAASAAARFVLHDMIHGELGGDFELMRAYKDGRARFAGYLEDYAYMSTGLLDLFETTADLTWLRAAAALVDRMQELFYDEEQGGFFYTAEHHRHLIVRQKDSYDGATPAANSVAIMALLRLSAILGRPELRDRADRCLRAFFPTMLRQPQAMTEMLQALDFHLRGPVQIVIAYPAGFLDGASEFIDRVWRHYLPNGATLIVPSTDDAPARDWAELMPWLAGKTTRNGTSVAYVCRDGTCRQPVDRPDDLAAQLPGR